MPKELVLLLGISITLLLLYPNLYNSVIDYAFPTRDTFNVAGATTTLPYEYIDDCEDYLDKPKTYYLTTDIVDSTETYCMFPRTDGVTLDCQGHLIDGVDVAVTYGIYIENVERISVQNCNFTDWQFGIRIVETASLTSATIKDSSFSSNEVSTSTGISMAYLTGSANVSNSTFFNNDYGILIERSRDCCIISNSTFHNHWRSLRITSGGGSTARDLIIVNSTGYGIGLDAHANPFYNLAGYFYNIFLNNSDNFAIIYPTLHHWNTTNQTGTRIYSSGTNIGGNYYTNSTSTGFSDTCLDIDTDGFCDFAYNLTNKMPCVPSVNCSEEHTDYLPLSNKYI